MGIGERAGQAVRELASPVGRWRVVGSLAVKLPRMPRVLVIVGRLPRAARGRQRLRLGAYARLAPDVRTAAVAHRGTPARRLRRAARSHEYRRPAFRQRSRPGRADRSTRPSGTASEAPCALARAPRQAWRSDGASPDRELFDEIAGLHVGAPRPNRAHASPVERSIRRGGEGAKRSRARERRASGAKELPRGPQPARPANASRTPSQTLCSVAGVRPM